MSDPQELALYQGHASAPVRWVRYVEPIGWERIDNFHLVLNVRPRESWLIAMTGPCLDWGNADQAISISHEGGMVNPGPDSVNFPRSRISCRIGEIRLVDPVAVRDARNALAATP